MGNTTYEIIEKLANVPIYKIHKLPKPGEDSDESCPKHIRVVYWNMLFPIDWKETEISEDRDNSEWHSDHQACSQQGEPLTKQTQWNSWCTTSGVWLWEHHTPSRVGGDNSNLVSVLPLPKHCFKGERPRACIVYLWRYLLIRVIVPCVEKNFGGGGDIPLTMVILQACLPPHRSRVQMFWIPKIYALHGGLSVIQHLHCITRYMCDMFKWWTSCKSWFSLIAKLTIIYHALPSIRCDDWLMLVMLM